VLELVQHPNVVALVETIDAPEGTYIVLEHLDGPSLERIITVRGKLSIAESLAVMRQACHAVAAVHAAGILHRDVKPSNFVVLGTNELERSPIKLIDFGTATPPRHTGPASLHPGPKLTGEQMVLGTAEYMPFEQLKGEKATPRGDVYALGVTLYECLTGRVPFEGQFHEVLYQWVLSSMLRVEELRPEIPRPIAELVARAVALDPNVRFEDAGAMLEALDAISPLMVHEPSSGIHLRPPDRMPSGLYRT
jgi:serine/threonine-protein kinase